MANYSFNYQIKSNAGELVSANSFDAEVNDQLMADLVETMRTNGGFPVDMPQVQKLDDYIFDQAMNYVIVNDDATVDEHFWDENHLEIEETLPAELIEAANKFITGYDMLIDFFYIHDGVEQHHADKFTVTPSTFWAMVKAAPLVPRNVKPFDFLKTYDSKAYEEIANIVLVEAAFKYGMSKYGKNIGAYLKEFPYQVYDYSVI